MAIHRGKRQAGLDLLAKISNASGCYPYVYILYLRRADTILVTPSMSLCIGTTTAGELIVKSNIIAITI